MKARPIALGVLLVAVPILAGCFGAPTEDTIPSETNRTPDLPVVKPDGRGGSFSAFNETNLTDNLGHHNHDYWQGRQRVTIFSGTAEIIGGQATFRPPSGPEHLVFEGTGSIEVLLTNPQRHVCEPVFNWNGALICTDHTQTGTPLTGEIKGPPIQDPAPSTSLRLEYLTAASGPEDWTDAGPAAFDVPTTIKVADPRWTDMPHSSGSLWAFRITSSDPADETLVFDIEATAVRAPGEVPQWPGHPIFYTDKKHYRVIYDDVSTTTSGGQFGPTTVETAAPAKLVSAGTRTLIVSANVSKVEGQVPGQPPSHLYLYYHNASFTNWNFTSPFDDNFTSDKGTYRWVIRVDPNGMDSPYAEASRWEFMLRAAFTTPLVSCYDGCYGYTLEYKLTIVATDLFPPCLQEEAGECVRYAYSQSNRA